MKWILKWNSIFSVWCPKKCVAYRLFSKFRWRDTSSAAENVKISYNLAIGRKRQLYARRCKIYFRIRIYLGVYFFDHRFIYSFLECIIQKKLHLLWIYSVLLTINQRRLNFSLKICSVIHNFSIVGENTIILKNSNLPLSVYDGSGFKKH